MHYVLTKLFYVFWLGHQDQDLKNLALGVFWDLFGVRVVSVDGSDGMGGSYHLDCYDF